MHATDAVTIDVFLAEIRQRGLEFRDRRRLPPDIVEKLKRIGVYRALVPRELGGDEVTPAAFLELVERISEADGSVGWVASLGMATVYLGALPRKTLEYVYRGSPDVVFAGRFAPLPAARTPKGFRVSGRWPFGSGCLDASLVGVAISLPGEEGGLTRVAVVPRDKVRIEDNWDTIGLAGTGSHDMVLEDVLVPEGWSLLWGGDPSIDVPVYHYPSLPLTAQAFAVVGLGCARRAISEFTLLARDSVQAFSRPALKDRGYVRASIARSEALLSAARAFLYEATDHAWKHVIDDGVVPVEQSNRVRLASAHLAHVASDVARRCWELAGTAAMHRDHILARCMQDCLVVAQHVYLSEGYFETAGRAILEFEPGPDAP